MPHVIEAAASGRAKCRGCGRSIAKGELRLGERLPNPFGEGEMTLWLHLDCAAFKRPEPLLEAMGATTERLDDEDALRSTAQASLATRRLPRIDGAEHAPSGRARCRGCRKLIELRTWRIRLVYYEEGRFEPSGFIHARCAQAYFESDDSAEILRRIGHFSADLDEDDTGSLRAELDAD